MSGAYTAQRLAAIIAEHGETMTLQREGETDITLKGKRIVGGTLEDVGNTSAQQNFRVKIAPTELEASSWASKVPTRTDAIVIGGRTRSIIDAQPEGDSGVVALYVLEVVG
jgi:hypothetical protein